MENLFSIVLYNVFLLFIGVVVLVIELFKTSKNKQKTKNSTVTKQFSKKIVVYIIVCLLMLIMKIPIFQDMAENETFTVIGMVSEITSGYGSGIKYAFVVEEHSNEKYKLRPTKK